MEELWSSGSADAIEQQTPGFRAGLKAPSSLPNGALLLQGGCLSSECPRDGDSDEASRSMP